MKKTAFLISACLCLLLFSCAPAQNPSLPPAGSEQPGSDLPVSSAVSGDNSVGELSDITAPPVVVESKTVVDGRAVVAGTCAEGAVITVSDGETELMQVLSDHGAFCFEYAVPIAKSPMILTLTAAVPGQAVSEGTEVRAVHTAVKECPVQNYVWIGSAFRLFFTNSYNQYVNNEHLSADSVAAITQTISRRVSSLAEDGVELIYVFVPNPNEIYPEYMPSEVEQGNVCLRTDVAEAVAAGGAWVLDMGSLMEEHRDDTFRTYHNTDSHWTEYGAYFAYDALLTHIAEKFPAAAPRALSEFGFANEFRNAGDLYSDLAFDYTKLSVYSTFAHPTFDPGVGIAKYRSDEDTIINDEATEEMQFGTSAEGKPDVLVMRDSYSVMLFDWLAERCGQSTFRALWDFDFDRSAIRKLGVDYVVYFVSDMNLLSVLR